MKRVYTGTGVMECDLRKGVLESHGIRCMIKNELLAPLAGGIPAPEVWPELWVLDDDRAEEAIQLLEAGKQGEGSSR